MSIRTITTLGFFYAATALLATSTLSGGRFDGQWVGTENLKAPKNLSYYLEKELLRPSDVTIIIAQNGTLIGKIGGVCPGRFQQVRRGGDGLYFDTRDCHFVVRLSIDGKMLTMNGKCTFPKGVISGTNGENYPVSWLPVQVSGTFHRSSDAH